MIGPSRVVDDLTSDFYVYIPEGNVGSLNSSCKGCFMTYQVTNQEGHDHGSPM